MSAEVPTIEEKVIKKSEPDIHFEEVAELESPLKRIIEKIRFRIETGEYGLIIGDDASGRIPALILGNFIRRISELKGLHGPNIVFIPGKISVEPRGSFWKRIIDSTYKKHNQEFEEYMSEHAASKEKKVLIVTDTIQSGFSLMTLVSLLRNSGYEYDIATIGIEQPMIGKLDRNINLSGADIFSGEYYVKERDDHKHTPLIYDNNKLSGVSKHPGESVSRPLKLFALPEGINPEDVNPESINIYESRREIQDSISQARKDASIVTDHLVSWYESQKQEGEK